MTLCSRRAVTPSPTLRTLDGELADEVSELVSFRGRFADQARTGQRVRAGGAVERVVWRDGRETVRLVVGGRPGDYLLGLEDGHSFPAIRG